MGILNLGCIHSEVLSAVWPPTLHLGVLLETLHRKVFEHGAGSPRAVLRPNPDYNPSALTAGAPNILEPIQEVKVGAGGVVCGRGGETDDVK